MSGENRPAVKPPVEETNSQWSSLLMTLVRNGLSESTFRIK